MKRQRAQHGKRNAILLILLCAILLAAAAFITFNTQSNTAVRKEVSLRETLSTTPNVHGRQFIGNNSADIVVILYADPDTTQQFRERIYPALEQYITTGKLKIYPKYYLTLDDWNQKTDTFKYVQALGCMEFLNPEAFLSYYQELKPGDDPAAIAEQYRIQRIVFENCMERRDLPNVRADMLEVERFGFAGVLPRMYVGIGNQLSVIDGYPSPTRLRLVLRQYLIWLGD